MNVNELMSREPRAVRMGDRLDAVARILWEQDCGAVPVVDASNVVVGMVTDRDVCMAAYTQGRPLNELPIAASMARPARTCRAEETAAGAMATMQQHQVHRLPVVDARGVLVGIVSTNDLVRAAHGRPAALDAGGVVKVLAAIGAPRRTSAPPIASPAPAKSTGAPAAAKPATATATTAAAVPPAGKAQAPVPPTAPTKDKGKPKGRKA